MTSPVKQKPTQEEFTLTIITHLGGIFASFIFALLVMLLTKKSQVKKHAQNAFNWQVSFIIYLILAWILSFSSTFIMSNFSNMHLVFPFSLFTTILTIINIAFCIIATLKASEGQIWPYPLSLNIISLIGESRINQVKTELNKVYRELSQEFKKKNK